ncbi:MAG: glycoside hydrolase family 13 [Verrucomicrobia bacterium]|nr:glycoside hydrolase family 13 [Verrucomicrobiota bacterium]
MSYSNPYPTGQSGRYSAKNISVAVNFLCLVSAAKQVSVVGDFNDWQPHSHPMKKGPDGSWRAQVTLCHGHHHYLFVVDGVATLDPRANGYAKHAQFGKVCMLAVS